MRIYPQTPPQGFLSGYFVLYPVAVIAKFSRASNAIRVSESQCRTYSVPALEKLKAVYLTCLLPP